MNNSKRRVPDGLAGEVRNAAHPLIIGYQGKNIDEIYNDLADIANAEGVILKPLEEERSKNN